MSYLADYIKKSLQNTPATSSSESGNEHNTQKSKKSAPSTLSELIQQSMGHSNSSINYDRVDDYNHGVDVLNYTLESWNKWYDASRSGLESVGFGDAGDAYASIQDEASSMLNRLAQSRKWAQENKDQLGDNYDAIMKSLQEATTATYWMNKNYETSADFYSRWDSQEAYDQAFAPTEQEVVMGKDVGQMQSDLDAMRQAYDDLDEILVYREAGYGTVPEAEREQKKAWHDERYQEILDAYGVDGTVSKWDLMTRISELEDEIGETSETQDSIRETNAEASRLAGYYVKYSGMDYGQLKQAMDTVTDPQEKAWLQSFAGTKMTAADYDVEIASTKDQAEAMANYIDVLNARYEELDAAIANYSASSDPEDAKRLTTAQKELDMVLRQLRAAEDDYDALMTSAWQLEHDGKYAAIRESEDFDEKSGFVTSFVDADGNVVDTTKDSRYRYINSKSNPDAFLKPGTDNYSMDSQWIGSGGHVYGYMNEDEVKTYNYIVRTQGWAAANDYLEEIRPVLDERMTAGIVSDISDITREAPVFANALSVGMNLTAGQGMLDIAAQNVGRKLSGSYKPVNYYGNSMTAAHASKAIRGTTAAMITDATGTIQLDEEDHPYLAPILNGRGLADVYQLGMSAFDSKVAALTGNPVLATTLLASSAATQGVLDALERGATDEQALTMGLWNGAFEALFEFAEVDALLKGNPNMVKNVVNQMITEGLGEGFTDVANSIADAFVMADKSKVMEDARKYMEENPGMTEKEAIWRAVGDAAIDAGWSMVGGAVSGGFAAGGQSLMQNYSADMDSGRYVQENQMQDPLMQLAQSMAGANTGKLDVYAQRAAERQSTRNMGRLYNEVNRVVDRQNMDQLAQALEGQGLSRKDATHLATAIGLDINGIELTKSQEKLLKQYEDSEKVMAAVEEVLGSTAFMERNSSVRNLGATQKKTPTAAQEAPGQEKAAETASVPEAKVETTHAVSEDGKTHLIEEPEKTVNIQGIESIKDGKMMLKLEDGSVVDSESVSYGDDGDALVYEILSDMNVSAENANAIYQEFKASNKPAAEFALDLQEAYQYGSFNQTLKEANNSPAAKLAWNEGRMAVISQSDTSQATVEDTYEKATETLKQSGRERRTDHHAVLAENITALSLTESQKASYELADRVAQAAKVDIVVYDGEALEQGYYKGDTVYLNLNASNKNRQSMMAFVLGHELVHRAKKGSPKKYQAFADFLVEQYGKQGSDVDAMIAEQMQAAKDNGIEMTPDEAFEEVVADACQRMLLDTDAGLKLAQFGAENKQNKSLLDDIKRWITEFIEKLRSIFKDVEPGSLAAQEFSKFEDGVKQILADMYMDMTMEAGEHLSAIKEAFGENATIETNDRGEFTMAQNANGSEKVFNLVTWKNGGRSTLEATLLREGYSREEVDAALTIMDGKQELVESIANEVNEDGKMAFPEQGRINEATLTTDIKDGHSVLSALVSNGDYPVNIDLLMVCKKRKAYQRVINRLCETGLIRQATVDALAIAQINKILGKYGFETACLGCFVESRRLRIQEWAQTIVSEWNSEVRKRDPNAKAFGFGKGEATLTADEVMQLVGELESGGDKNDKGNLNLGQGSAVKRMGVLLDKVPSLRKTLSMEDLVTPEGLTALRRMDSNLFSMVKSRYGSNSPKFVQEFNPYNHELAMYGKVPKQYKSLREYLYAIGGARMQSFSDFIVENWFDYCQIVADLAARKLPMHTYTKEISMVKLFGMTGIKINMSLIPDVDRSLGKEYAGLTINEDGQLELIWSDKDRFKATGGTSYMQSINFADAMALQNDPRYSSNVGTIAIGISDRQIRMMLNDSRIRMVIPYHSSGMNPIFADLMGTSFYKDYTNFQNTTVKQMYDSNGKPVKVKMEKAEIAKLVSGFQFNETMRELGDARAAAEAYKEWCADASKHTITLNGKTYTAELTPKFNDFRDEQNYYKLLADFNPYDCITEEAAPQGDVQQIYPEGFEDILRSELKGQEGHRHKQEKNQAFDKAMGEIESYLQTHTKADTVYYAEQHGVKLGAKDKKLDAAGKERLAQLRKEGASFKLPVGEDTSPRALLANAFEGVVQNDIEKRNLERYQSRVAELDAEEAKLKELRAEIRELSESKPRDEERTRELRTEANATANRINTLDKMLLRFEASAPLQEVIKREREAVRSEERNRANSRVNALRDSAEVRQGEILRKYRATRESLTDQKRNTSVMEREFIRLAREYEKLETRTIKNSASMSQLRDALSAEAKSHRDDQRTWEREFDRLLKEYDAAGRKIDSLVKKMDAQTQKAKDTVKRIRDTRDKAEMRRKIRKVIRDLDKLFSRGDKHKNVKEGMRDLAATALASAEVLFMDGGMSEHDMIRNGFRTPVSERESKLINRASDLLKQLDDPDVEQLLKDIDDPEDIQGAAVLAEQQAKVRKELYGITKQLQEAFERERKAINNTLVTSIIEDLAKAYKALENSPDPYISGAYRAEVYELLHSLYIEGNIFGFTRVKDMNMEQMGRVYDAYEAVLTAVRDANKLFDESIKETRQEFAEKVMIEESIAARRKAKTKLGRTIEKFAWDNLKPVYAFERIGSATLSMLYGNIRKGQDSWAVDMEEANQFRLEAESKYGFNEWDMEKGYDFVNPNGKKFTLTLPQIMSIYAYSKRPHAHDHLTKGGIVFADNTMTTVTKAGIKFHMMKEDATAYRLSMDTLNEIIGTLKKEQTDYVDEMQKYLSEVMGEKGNSVSMKLYGIKLFNEEHYFPLRSSEIYSKKTKEANFQKEQGQINLVNSGFAKALTPKASNPIILDSFGDVWSDHVNDMSLYHSFVLPMEDFRRVYNYKTAAEGEDDVAGVAASIQNANGKAAIEYIDQLYRDLNGGALTDPREGIAKALTGKFKKAAVMASLSVVFQQPSAIGRAFAEIDLKHFESFGLVRGVSRAVFKHKEHDRQWAELKRYAPVAMIKEMGYFDTGMGLTAKEYLQAKEYSGIKEKAKALFTDGKYRDELLGKAASVADELTWVEIWRAVKNETAARNPKMDKTSEEFLKIAGDRFSEVIDKTQVYDSVLARSANMRSKSLFMNMATSFMAEPTTAINMIEDALRKGAKGQKKYAARVMGAVFCSIVINAALSSLVYAGRDDDEDETYLEKYLSRFLTEIIDGVNPITYIPFLKDAWSIAQGFDVERADMALISDLMDVMKKLVQLLDKDTSEMNEDALREHQKAVRQGWMSALDVVASLLGIPLKNARREVKGAVNLFGTLKKDFGGRKTTWGSLGDVLQADIQDTIPVWGWLNGETKGEKLYEAIVRGDDAYVERIIGGYKDRKTADEAIGKMLRENDPRIRNAAEALASGDVAKYNTILGQFNDGKYFTREIAAKVIDAEYSEIVKDLREKDPRVRAAAQARLDGDFETYRDLFYEIRDEGMYDFDTVMKAVNAEETALEKLGASTEVGDAVASDDYEAVFKVEHYYSAVLNGDTEAAELIYDELIEEKRSEGYLKSEAESSIASSFTTQVKNGYMDGSISRDKAIELLADHTSNDESKVKEWDFELEHDFSWSARARKYRLGEISADELMDAVMDIEGDSEEDAQEYIRFLDLEMEHEDIDITADDASAYFKHAEPAGISVDVWLDYKERTAGIENDVDPVTGKKIKYTAVKRIMKIIDELDLTPEQKTALAKSQGWADSTIRSYKLW